MLVKVFQQVQAFLQQVLLFVVRGLDERILVQQFRKDFYPVQQFVSLEGLAEIHQQVFLVLCAEEFFGLEEVGTVHAFEFQLDILLGKVFFLFNQFFECIEELTDETFDIVTFQHNVLMFLGFGATKIQLFD